jgi:hypothetical protein
LPPHGAPAHARAASARAEARLTRPLARAGVQTTVAVLLVRAARPSLDAGALRQYIAKPGKESGKATEGQRQERRSRLPPGAKRLTEPPHEGEGRWQESAARAERSGAGACLWSPLGGDEVWQGAAAVRARCRTDGGQGRRLAAQRLAGAVQWRRCISRCTDRSAGGCADWHTFSTTRARASGGLEAAEASPLRCAGWSADCGAAGCPWSTARARVPAAGHCTSPAAGSAGPLRGYTAVAVTQQAPVHVSGRCSQGLGKTGYRDGRMAAVQGTSPSCLLGKQREETGEGESSHASDTGAETSCARATPRARRHQEKTR